MKKLLKNIAFISLASITFSSCLEETFPTDIATSDQVSVSEEALGALSNSVIAYMTTYDGGTSDNTNFGYAGFMMWRDVMLQDMPVYSTSYDYFNYGFGTTSYLGDYPVPSMFWTYHYNLINNANLLIGSIDPETMTETTKSYLGNALVYRAMAYIDLSRYFEYKHTGVSSLDSKAEANGIYGLTVPLITENTSEEEGRNNPRVPFYKMYRFIMNDLNNAEKYLSDFQREKKNWADLSVVYGMKARLWMELGSRFELYPDDLETQISHDKDAELETYASLNINSASDCYANAASYARKVIDKGYTPVGEAQWHDTASGFNTVNDAWIFAILIGANDGLSSWKAFISQISPEQTFGTTQYGAYRMIGKSLFDKIPDADWRKTSWIAPDDAGKNPVPSQYKTLLSDEQWANIPAYTGFKFRPNQGNMGNYLIGNVVNIPLMRVEEMYFIEAEAVAHTQGVQTGISLLENFMNTYRYKDGSYKCNSSNMELFIDELLVQKRIEFWGEGILAFDYKRLEKQIIRGYAGTNTPATHRYNSIKGYAAPWMNVYITSSEYKYNLSIINNPDPSSSIEAWEE